MAEGPDAFSFAVIAYDLPDRIDCICPWVDRLLVGLADGSLLLLVPEFELHDVGPWIIQEHFKSIGKRGFTQIEVISSIPAMLSLSSGVLAMHSLPHLSSLISNININGGSPYRFAWSDDVSMLCVAVRKNLVFYALQEMNFVEKTTVTIPDTVKLMMWCGKLICYGTRAKYIFVDPETNQITESINMGRSGLPTLTPLPDNKILLGRDTTGFYVNLEDNSIRGVKLQWSSTPMAVVLCSPFVVGLFNNVIEVRNISPTARQCIIQMFNDVDYMNIAASSIGVDGSVFMASRERKTVSRLNPVPLTQLIEMLIEMKEFQDALQVVELLNEEEQLITEDDLRISYGIHLFASKEYNEGLMQFSMRSQRTPLLPLRMFPSLLPPEMMENYPLPPESEKYFEGFQEPQGEDYVQAVGSLLPLLLAECSRLASRRRDDFEQDRRQKESSLKSISEEEGREDSDETDSGIGYYGVTGVGRTLSASKMLSRVKRNNLAVLVDTAIMEAMLICPDGGGLLQFVRRPNSIDLNVGDKSLRAAGRYLELAYLYKTYNKHDIGLEILRKLSLEPEKFSVPPRGAAAELRGVTGTWAAVNYLSSLSEEDADVIKKHSKWVIEQDPEACLEVFVGSDHSFPPSVVLPILTENAPQFSALYLEAVLEKGDVQEEDYHGVLVGIYLQEALVNEQKLGPMHILASDVQKRYDFESLNEQSTRRLSKKDELISNQKSVTFAESLKDKNTFVFPTAIESYCRLRELLVESEFIDAREILDKIPYELLLELQALLLERKVNYKSALRVYIQRMKNLNLAEALCDRVYEKNKSPSTGALQSLQTFEFSEQTENLYMDMIRIYLEPQEAGIGEIRSLTEDEWKHLGMLFCRKRYRINIEEMFELLPGDVELQVFMTFIEGGLRTLSEQQRNHSIVHKLRSCENLLRKEQIIRCHQRSVMVTYESACVICHKRIGNAVFVAYPNGSLAHISCYTRQNKTNTTPSASTVSSSTISRSWY